MSRKVLSMPLFKRHKILLGVLLKAPRIPTRTELMKWLFLLRQETCLCSEKSFYDFVPYKYGPFSFTVYRDLEELARLGFLNGNGFTIQAGLLSDARELFNSLPSTFQNAIEDVIERHASFPQSKLVEIVYNKYPWFASRSNRKKISQKNIQKRKAIFTAGYEGKSVDLFLQELLKGGIERIIDVRNNPLSRKYGFSKGALSRLSSNLDIDYVHLKALGIPPSNRDSLTTFEDYQKLLCHYEHSILPKVPEARLQAMRLLKERPSVLVCFEADSQYCHRGRLAEAISADTGLDVVHL